MALAEGRVLSLVLPLGKGFSIPADTVSKVLLAGGGVGVAPMLYLGSELKKRGFEVAFLLGARSKGDLLELEEFGKIGSVYVSTDHQELGIAEVVADALLLRSDADDEGNGVIRYAQQH